MTRGRELRVQVKECQSRNAVAGKTHVAKDSLRSPSGHSAAGRRRVGFGYAKRPKPSACNYLRMPSFVMTPL